MGWAVPSVAWERSAAFRDHQPTGRIVTGPAQSPFLDAVALINAQQRHDEPRAWLRDLFTLPVTESYLSAGERCVIRTRRQLARAAAGHDPWGAG